MASESATGERKAGERARARVEMEVPMEAGRKWPHHRPLADTWRAPSRLGVASEWRQVATLRRERHTNLISGLLRLARAACPSGRWPAALR